VPRVLLEAGSGSTNYGIYHEYTRKSSIGAILLVFSRQSSHLIEQTACPPQGRSGHSVLHLDPSRLFVLRSVGRREVDLLGY